MVNNFTNALTIDDTKYLAWVNDASGARKEVTHTFYDNNSVFGNQLAVIGFVHRTFYINSNKNGC